jgi:prophage tail gpP-like protein
MSNLNIIDIVTLETGGKIFQGWEQLTITRALESGADGFSFMAAFDSNNQDIKTSFKPYEYQECKVKIDDELIITGNIDTPAFDISISGNNVNIQGRSKTGVLIDCSYDGKSYQFRNMTLKDIASAVCSPFGISVNCINNSGNIIEAILEPGQTPFEFLSGLAQANSLLISNDINGNLLIFKPDILSAPVQNIIEGKDNFISGSSSFDGQSRHSIIKVNTQQDGGNSIQGIAIDNFITKYRPIIINGSETDGQNIIKAAEWKRAQMLAASFGINVIMAGFRTPSGVLYSPGHIVTLKAPSIYIYNETPFLIAEDTFSIDPSGKTTSMRLVLLSTYSGEMPKAMPWG